MNFFEQQDRARKQTRLLVGAFVLAVMSILVAMNLVALIAYGRVQPTQQDWTSAAFWSANAPVVLWTSIATLAVIVLASLYRSVQLRGGGAQVARELGGVEVDGSTTDPLRRRLLNVVEEMAIASGVPVPAVFVLEHEAGINAFAAGWSPSDAAVAVTRGTLETLNREELQGVIAHEFSHVFNGDMRLNIRLMGVLFGILVLAVVGRKMMVSMRFSTGRNRNGGAVVLVALGIMVIGYIGLFFGRWIKAAVSRQREYLADASAVQFTRSPDGISGALKKIGAASAGSTLEVDTEEVGHMMFASSLAGRMFATHPPLPDRIRKIDPSFEPSEFQQIAEQIDRHRQAREAEAEQAAVEQAAPDHAMPGGINLDPGQLTEQIGRPGVGQMLMVAALLAEIPTALERAAHSDEWAPELIAYLLLGADRDLREQQLLLIAEHMGSDSEAQVRNLLDIEPELSRRLRLPLLELAFPALRRRPPEQLERFRALVDRLIEADGRVSVFEFALARLLVREIRDTLEPPRKAPGGPRSLRERARAAVLVIDVVARHGHPSDAHAARAALRAALDSLPEPLPEPSGSGASKTTDDQTGNDTSGIDSEPGWQARLDNALDQLDDLSMEARGQLVSAVLECVRHDGKVVTAEYELLRLVAGVLRVPLPMIEQT